MLNLQVNVFKPVTSKAGNSEQYIICMKYKGKTILNDAYWDRLKLGFGMYKVLESDIWGNINR